jgi:glycosyltransferase involved in cell wall biosynthesis
MSKLEMKQKPCLRFLCLAPNKYPPRHVDVSVLFGDKLAGRGHKIDFLLQSKDACTRFYRTEWNTIRVFVGATNLGPTILSRAMKRILDLMNNLKAFPLTRQEEYDFVQVKDRFVSAMTTLLAVKLTKKRCFYWLCYPFPEAYLHSVKAGTARYPMIYFLRGHLYKFLLYKIILPAADHIFVQSDQMKRDIGAKGIPKVKMTPVPMGVSLESIPYADSRSGRERQIVHRNHKIVYLGTLIRPRKMDFLIKVFEKVLQKLPEARLYMIGEGEDSGDVEFLRKLSEDLGIADRVTFTGFLPMKEAWKHVEDCAVGVSPYLPTPILNSTSPTKLVEYMAMGKPVVGNDHPEQSKVIRESGAGLCVPYEIDAFAEAILEILQNPEQALEMGIKGREYVEQNRSYDKIADLVEETYFRLCSQ